MTVGISSPTCLTLCARSKPMRYRRFRLMRDSQSSRFCCGYHRDTMALGRDLGPAGRPDEAGCAARASRLWLRRSVLASTKLISSSISVRRTSSPTTLSLSALIAAMRRLGDLYAFRNFVLIGTAIPEDIQGCCQGRGCSFRVMIGSSTRRFLARCRRACVSPNYGDYTIVHPDFTPMDMRMIKSAGKLVYTTPANWEVRKGGAFRDNPEQMHDHCASIVGSGKFQRCAATQAATTTSPNARLKEGPEQSDTMEGCGNQSPHHACAGRSRHVWRCAMKVRMEAVISRRVIASQSIS